MPHVPAPRLQLVTQHAHNTPFLFHVSSPTGAPTLSGLTCATQRWTLAVLDAAAAGGNSPSGPLQRYSGCANPNADPLGAWCALPKGRTTPSGASWDYCLPACNETPSPPSPSTSPSATSSPRPPSPSQQASVRPGGCDMHRAFKDARGACGVWQSAAGGVARCGEQKEGIDGPVGKGQTTKWGAMVPCWLF